MLFNHFAANFAGMASGTGPPAQVRAGALNAADCPDLSVAVCDSKSVAACFASPTSVAKRFARIQ
jgi:hypothetical protein